MLTRSTITMCISILALCVGYALPADVQAGGTKTIVELRPPVPLPEGVDADGHAHAVLEGEPGIRERLKLEIEDVAVIGEAADPEFCRGFYVVVLTGADGVEIPLPQFPGVIVTCDVGGFPQGPSQGNINFEVNLRNGQQALGFSGKMLSIYEVDVVRDLLTGKAIPGPNGEPFFIDHRGAVALRGLLQ